VPAGAPLEGGETRLLAVRQAAEERLVRLVESGQPVLQDMRVDGRVVRHRCPEVLQRGFLLATRDRDVAASPSGAALLEGGIGEHAAAPQHRVQRLLLGERSFSL
jgi:hypothetical protein